MVDDIAPTLGSLPTLPVFLKLRGRRVVLAGGAEPAVWKAEVLCAAGARVEAFAEAPCAALEALARGLPDGALTLTRREWRPDDLHGAAVALGAIEGKEEAEAFRAAAVAAGVPVNVVDKPALCDFQFGTIVDRAPLVLAITTDGAAPVFGQAVRARIEALLPEGLRDWAVAAQAWRPTVQARGWGFRQRRRFWEAFADLALRSDRRPAPVDLDTCLQAAEGVGQTRTGAIALLGCGSGALEDVTFGVVRALQAVDAVLYDPDVPAEIVNLARREGSKERIDDSAGPTRAQDLVRDGAQVAWLGTGNPITCARWAVRASQLARLDVHTTRLPGLGRCPYCGDVCQDGSPR